MVVAPSMSTARSACGPQHQRRLALLRVQLHAHSHARGTSCCVGRCVRRDAERARVPRRRECSARDTVSGGLLL